jgi:hypothetical protein
MVYESRLTDRWGMIHSHLLARFLIELNARKAEDDLRPEPVVEAPRLRPRLLKAGRFAS